jgi:hypothetical protein
MFWIIFLISKLFREDIFKDCGEIVDVRFNTDPEGRFRGFGHVEFGTAEAAQKVSVCPYVVCTNHFTAKYNSKIILPLEATMPYTFSIRLG